MSKSNLIKVIGIVLIAGVLFGAGILTASMLQSNNKKEPIKSSEMKDKYVSFSLEIYDKVKEFYWDKVTDDDLSNIFLLATDKLTGITHSLETRDRAGVEELVTATLKEIDSDKKKEYVAKMGDMVLANLKPFGRSRLYSQKEEKTLSNTVNNINPEADHFKTLEVGKSASNEEVEKAFEKKVEEIKKTEKDATKAAEKVAEAKQAYKVLKDDDSRKIYEIAGIEPTIEYKLLSPEIFYVHLTKFSPTSLEEFVRVMAKPDKGDSLDTLIFDLRGNIGGAIDSLPYFLGPFIGPDTYAYQFFRQGVKEDYKTKTGWLNSLVRYKKVVILIDEYSQSSAEVMAASLKKYNVGVVLGTTTKGWGTVERVIQMDNQIDDTEKFSLFMVHRVTVRDDGQLIEGAGVEPMISIKDPEWKKKLNQHFNTPTIIRAIEDIYAGNI